jgi:DNA (cytosine-5)-methyltransferase 1
MSFKYLSLFSGAGGLDIGLERAGLESIALTEIEPVFCETLRRNAGWQHSDGKTYLSKARIIEKDISTSNPSELTYREDVDLIVGGPPCQAFSSSGKQLSVLDPRGTLVFDFCRFISDLRPKMFLFENVRGLVTARDSRGEPGGVIKEISSTLEALGYSCRIGILNSADFGAFQRRVRCFILGSRNGEAPDFPTPTHSKGGGLFGEKWRTLGEFLDAFGDTNTESFVFPSEELGRKLKDIPSGSGIKSPGKSEPTRPGGHWGYRQGTFIADLEAPARTVTGSASQDWIRWDGLLRRLTFSEIKLLQGFPSDWIVEGTQAQRFKQIGNAVPTVFGEAFGKVIVDHLTNFPSSQAVKLEMPKSIVESISYTKKDHQRNASARSIHKQFED